MAESVIISREQQDMSDIKIPLPVFVKPNNNGSSYGVSKVSDKSLLPQAIELAFQYDDEVMVEGYIEGREFGCGVVREGNVLHALPVTEIIPAEGKDFFDYEAKYLGASQEITPANLTLEETKQIQARSIELYQLLSCRGVVRVDFILKNGIFYLLEVNTIPGMSEASIVPQQAIAYGWKIEHLLDVIIEDCIRR